MKLTVVTGWSPAGYVEYGKRFAETFHRHMPPEINLIVYGEEPCHLPRGTFRTLKEVPGLVEFLSEEDTPIGHGLHPHGSFRKYWKASHLEQGYSFRYDAWKFCRQGFIPHHAATLLMKVRPEEQLLSWFDGDVVFHKDVPRGTIEALLPADRDVAYLGRGAKHSEIGFQLYRLPTAMPMLSAFKTLYDSRSVFDLKEWHSAYCFDHARASTARFTRSHDLTPGGMGHVWMQSPLARFSDHLKGSKRKEKGRSDERP